MVVEGGVAVVSPLVASAMVRDWEALSLASAAMK